MYDLELATLARDLALNLVALFLVAYVTYFRRHRRRDPFIGYVAFNLSLFSVSAALAGASALTIGVGFGLFAVLSIVRLRSEESTQAEIGYTMVVLVLGLLCGLPGLRFEHKAVLAAVLVVAMFAVDHPRVVPLQRSQRSLVVLDHLVVHPEDLRTALSARLGGTVREYVVREIDFVRETMVVDVSWDPPTATSRAPRSSLDADIGHS
jgi:hypothetical protein